jgi:hypothetical protein
MGDLREHEASPECWCGPHEESDGVWVHNSLDRREAFERRREVAVVIR